MSVTALARLSTEPIQSGIITGFAALCSAAVFNVGSTYLLGNASAPGPAGFVLAAAVSVVAGGVAAARASRQANAASGELAMAQHLAQGDYSNCIAQGSEATSPMTLALTAIAERQLAIETSSARLVKDASLRDDQVFAALDAVSSEVSVYDRDGLLLVTNRAFIKRCNAIGALVAPGMMRSEVYSAIARSPGANLPLNERETWYKQQADIRAEALAAGQPVRFTRFGGDPATIAVSATAEGGEVEVINDMSAVSSAEDRAERAEREASAADRIKAVTLSRLSHTIRTPMTGVMTAAELMMRSPLDPTQRERLDIIRRSSATLLGVVQDMFDLAAEARDSADAKDKNAAAAAGPRRAIVQVQDSSLFDALRTTLEAEGFEVARAETMEIALEAAAQLAVSTRPVDRLIVETGEQAEQMAASLAARLCEPRPSVMAARDVVSAAPQVAVAETTPAPQTADHAGHAQTGGFEVLVVEDEDVCQIVYGQALEALNCAYKVAGNGAEAITLAAAGAPRLILMDVSMPGMNGIEATRRIREMAGERGEPPVIIGMTSHFLPGDKAKCLAAGMDDYALKPETASAMQESLQHWLPRGAMKKAG